MKDNEIVLVTGANGHLGNNLARELLNKNIRVKASVRDIENKKPFLGLSCELVYADMLDKKSLLNAFKGVDILYHVAAVFKHWAKNPKKEILEANLSGTQNVIEAAAECGIKKIIYVSSIAALDFSQADIDEKNWGKEFPNMYFKSKNDSEKLAWQLANKFSLNMISVLPSGMIGPEIFGHYTPSMDLLYKIIKNLLSFDPQYEINYVHVKDVAIGMILAEKNGKTGERYILGNEYSLSTTDVIKIAKSMYPSVRIPKKANKKFQFFLAEIMRLTSRLTGNPPLLLKGNIIHYYKNKENLNIHKAQVELGYNPRKPEIALRETFEYIAQIK
jgi:dihydroflavonol-4-reductase